MKPEIQPKPGRQVELRVQCRTENVERRGIIKVSALVKSTNMAEILEKRRFYVFETFWVAQKAHF
jgi:hypothetical protein